MRASGEVTSRRETRRPDSCHNDDRGRTGRREHRSDVEQNDEDSDTHRDNGTHSVGSRPREGQRAGAVQEEYDFPSEPACDGIRDVFLESVL